MFQPAPEPLLVWGWAAWKVKEGRGGKEEGKGRIEGGKSEGEEEGEEQK